MLVAVAGSGILKSSGGGGTLFVSLSRMPRSTDEVIHVSDAILRGDSGASWRCIRWPRELVEAGDWSPTQWLSLNLATLARKISLHSMLRPLGYMARVAPAHVRGDIRNPISDPSRGPYRVLWRHQTGKIQTMRSHWEAEVDAKLGREGRVENTLWPQASRLLIANRLRTNTTRVASVLLDQPALGSQWTPITPIMESHWPSSLEIQKSWCVWLNSTLGVLGFLHRRGRTLTYSDFMPKVLQSMPCLDPATADIERLAEVYDRFHAEPLQPWSSLAKCPIRAELDNAVADVLGMDRAEVTELRNQISLEPTVSGVVDFIDD